MESNETFAKYEGDITTNVPMLSVEATHGCVLGKSNILRIAVIGHREELQQAHVCHFCGRTIWEPVERVVV